MILPGKAVVAKAITKGLHDSASQCRPFGVGLNLRHIYITISGRRRLQQPEPESSNIRKTTIQWRSQTHPSHPWPLPRGTQRNGRHASGRHGLSLRAQLRPGTMIHAMVVDTGYMSVVGREIAGYHVPCGCAAGPGGVKSNQREGTAEL